jgi:ribosomal protein S13
MELSTNELREIALGLNLLASERNVYLLDDSNEKYKENIKGYLKLDNDLIRKVTNEIKRLKESEEC